MRRPGYVRAAGAQPQPQARGPQAHPQGAAGAPGGVSHGPLASKLNNTGDAIIFAGFPQTFFFFIILLILKTHAVQKISDDYQTVFFPWIFGN